MEEHYEFQFFEDPMSIEDVRLDPPATSVHPLDNCHSSLLFRFARTLIHRQRFFLRHFQAELLQIDSEEPFMFRYRTQKNRLFILFCLHGEIRFTTVEKKVMTVARKGYFYVSRNSPGTYNVHCRKKGTSLALAVSISPKWAKRKAKDYPLLKEALGLLMGSERSFGIMPHCEINDDVVIWLRFLQRFANSSKKDFGRMLKNLIRNALKYYEDHLKNRDGEPIYRVKRYIEENFRDPLLTSNTVSEKFHLEEKTMRKRFVMEFHVTPTRYITMLRLREAKKLMDVKGLSMSEVWLIVGYNDLETFRQAYSNQDQEKSQ